MKYWATLLPLLYQFSMCRTKVNNTVGVDYDEGPPVPISNTVVKLICADDT